MFLKYLVLNFFNVYSCVKKIDTFNFSLTFPYKTTASLKSQNGSENYCSK